MMTTRRRLLKCDVGGDEEDSDAGIRRAGRRDDDEGVRDGDGPRLGDVDVRPRLDGDATFGRLCQSFDWKVSVVWSRLVAARLI